MRALSSDYRLGALSVPEISDEFEDVARDLGRRRKFNGRKLKAGPLLNALALSFLRLSESEREAFVGRWVGELELLLSETDEERAAATARLERTDEHPPVGKERVSGSVRVTPPTRARKGKGAG